jgi:hypothetical protein
MKDMRQLGDKGCHHKCLEENQESSGANDIEQMVTTDFYIGDFRYQGASLYQ